MKKKYVDFDIVIDKSDKSQDIPTMLVNQMVKHIADGVLQPGDRLPSELEMTRRFKISRISLREAMKLLEAKGYIESFGKQGKFVCSTANISLCMPIVEMVKNGPENIKNLFELKRMIFAESAYIAAQRAGDDNVQEMYSLLEEYRKNICNTENGRESYFKLMTFISKSTGNIIFSHVAVSLAEVLQTFINDSEIEFNETKRQVLVNSLEEVLKAISTKDADSAKRNMSIHLNEMEGMVS